MERTAKATPKSCYALEFDLHREMCQRCEFQTACFNDMGVRSKRVTLDKIIFKLVPSGYNMGEIDIFKEDPEISEIEQTYLICHRTVFGCKPHDRVGQYKNLIIAALRKANCSLRLFMLANMVGYQQREITLQVETERDKRNSFSAKLLTTAQAHKRLDMYREACRKNFGSFDLGSLSSLTGENYAENDIEQKMLHSEITAARVLIARKLMHGGPGMPHVYAREELTLDPFWLATEPTYMSAVLEPHRAGSTGTKAINSHRFSVTQVIAQMKRHRDWSIAIYQARERIMQKALATVLHTRGFVPIDFEFDEEVVTNAMDFWTFIARAIQHWQCLRFVNGDDEHLRL